MKCLTFFIKVVSGFIDSLKPQKVFVVIAVFFGVAFIFITPPFHIPDELVHFYRAFQVSTGKLIPIKTDNRVGGNIPVSLEKITDPFIVFIFYPNKRVTFEIIKTASKIPLNKSVEKFVDFPNTAVYSPFCYLPQAFSIFVLRTFDLNPLYIYYGTRLFTLIFWILCIYSAISMIPIYKWLFCFIALLPMSVFINMSLSADVMANSVAFLFIALVLKLSYSQSQITGKQLFFFYTLIFLLVSVKIVYTPLILISLVIPKNKFAHFKTYYLNLLLVPLLVFISVIFWGKFTNNLYVPFADYNSQYRGAAALVDGANMYQQMDFILKNDWYIFNVFIKSIHHTFNMYFEGYIGTFGWLDTKLPLWLVYFSYCLLFAVAILDGDKDIRTKPIHRTIFLLAFIVTLCLVLLSQHLTWVPVGWEFIGTIQGRYFIPFAPLLFMLFHTKFSARKITPVLVLFFTVLSLSFSVYILYCRYYSN